MTHYEKKWHELTKISPESYLYIFKFKSDMILIVLRETYVDDLNGLSLYTKLLFQTLNFNYAFSEEIYDQHKELLDAAIGYDITFEEAQRYASLARRENKAFEEFADDIGRMFKKIPEDIKEDIVTICLLLGSINQRPTYKVRSFFARYYQED